MTQDQHDPAIQALGANENTSPSDTEGTAPKAAASRTPRRRHTPSRGRKPKDQQETKETRDTQEAKEQDKEQHKEQPGERHGEHAAPATEALTVPTAPAAQAAPAAVATAPVTTADTSKRPATRGRRGGNNRRRNGKSSEAPDVQLVPVVNAAEPAEQAGPADIEATEKPDLGENPLVESLPATEPLPLDTAILAHLDALYQAAERQGVEQDTAPTSVEEQAHASAPEAATEPQEEPTPPSRYRFGRRRTQAAAASTAPRPERLSGWRATPPTLMTPAATTEPEVTPTADVAQSEISTEPVEGAATAELPAAVTTVTETPEAPTESESTEAAVTTEEQEAPAAETSEGEDQAEHEGASRRRRRRRGRGAHAQEAENGEAEGEEQHEEAHEEPRTRRPAPYVVPETSVSYAPSREMGNGYLPDTEGYEEVGYTAYAPTPRTRAPRPSEPATRYPTSPWNMTNAQQHVQEPSSPFGAPEPSFAHGFGPQSAGVATPHHETAPRTRRNDRAVEAPPMSANQLGAIITNAITQQTDRLLGELRRQQNPPSMTVALPAFPSTERIGVFVDVANLLYSARSQRTNIDFGRLLEFLRGNRRLIRAHAYAPTNPDPHAEQTFLSAVKGVGYRITTKNYKTFASGARKADMDLDLCMDIVRLVDADALDTVVLVSGDSDFLPLLEYCSDHGVRVEVAAFDDAASMILRQSCDLFINLSQVDEIRY